MSAESGCGAGADDLSFKAPGYSADAFTDAATGKDTLKIGAQGAVAVLNDLHRGRDAGSAWAWLIDLRGRSSPSKPRVKALLSLLAASLLVLLPMRAAMG